MIPEDYFRLLSCHAELIAEQRESIARADARIAELERSVTIRDTEIARLETDLEIARIGARRYEVARRMNVPQWKAAFDFNLRGLKPFDRIIDELRPFYFPDRAGGLENKS